MYQSILTMISALVWRRVMRARALTTRPTPRHQTLRSLLKLEPNPNPNRTHRVLVGASRSPGLLR